MKENNRLFLAIYPNKNITNTLSKAKNAINNNEQINWINKKNYHITIFFLGNVRKILIPELIHEFNFAFNKINKFWLKFQKINLIPNDINPKMIWAQFQNNKNFENIVQISKKICSKHLSKNFDNDQKELIPHITLAKIKKNYEPNIEIIQPKINDIFVNNCFLVKSELTNQGSNYIKIATFKLN